MREHETVNVGVIGCGAISGVYLQNMTQVFRILKVKACADAVMERAVAKAREYPGVVPMTVDELLADPEISIVANLTIPSAHAEVAFRCIAAGKSVYNEKPLALRRKQGRKLLKMARKKGVLVGCAPDTFMGAGIQTSLGLIRRGLIGEPIAAVAFMMCHGHEGWHPSPEFYYRKGGGPMFDMGPYYLTALVTLIGPVASVSGMTRITFPYRTITSEPLRGKRIKVEVPTHLAGLLRFRNGGIGTMVTSFDIWGTRLPNLEIYGTEGSLSVPDPNTFGGPVRIRKPGQKEWREVRLTHGYADNSRGIGIADMACALTFKRPHRPSGEMAYHVLDVMHAFHDAAEAGQEIRIESTCRPPVPLPVGLKKGELDGRPRTNK